MKNGATFVLILLCLAQIRFGSAQQEEPKSAPPVLLSQSELQNCPGALVTSTRFEGTTHMRAVIDADGRPIRVTVADSSGSRTLDATAVECVRRSPFRAALRDGKSVEGEIKIALPWMIPPTAQACSASMPVAWEIVVAVTPSPTVPDPLPAGAESLVCVCVNGAEISEPVILRSAGSRLDEGAIKLIKQAHKPANGWTGCYAETFRFKVKPQPTTQSDH